MRKGNLIKIHATDMGIDRAKSGKRIHQLMRLRGLSIQDVSDSLETVSRRTVNYWCNGQKLPELGSLVGLSQLLGCPINDLLVLSSSSSFSTGIDTESNHSAQHALLLGSLCLNLDLGEYVVRVHQASGSEYSKFL